MEYLTSRDYSPHNPQEIFQFSSLKNKSKPTKPKARLCKIEFIKKNSCSILIKESSYKVSEFPRLYTQCKTKKQKSRQKVMKKSDWNSLKELRDNCLP